MLCEKPLALSLESADRILSAARESGKTGIQQFLLHTRLGLAFVQLEPGEDEAIGVPPLVRITTGMFAYHLPRACQYLSFCHDAPPRVSFGFA